MIHGQIPAGLWAQMLALPAAETNGVRRINDALSWLHDNDYIDRNIRKGKPPVVMVKSPLGDGSEMFRPVGIYVRVPLGFWRYEWINALSGSGIALLLILLDAQGGKRHTPERPPSVPGERRRKYGFSDDFWTRAIKELQYWRILTVGRERQGRDFDVTRMRNTYWIDLGRLDENPLT